jgi:hypothetical protein
LQIGMVEGSRAGAAARARSCFYLTLTLKQRAR